MFGACCCVYAQGKEAPVIPEGEKAVVRVHFSGQKMGNMILKSFEARMLESDYGKGYHLMLVGQEDLDKLIDAGVAVEVTSFEVPDVIEAKADDTGDGTTIPNYSCYRTVEGTYATAERIIAENPGLASWLDVGDSWNKLYSSNTGYDMQVLVLTSELVQVEKPKLFITAAMHAREYATAELVTRFAEMLVDGYGVDPDITWILDHHEIHLMLQTNPDGRKIAENRVLWRKNTNEGYCLSDYDSRGADLNRNFTFGWNCCGGSSDDECNLTYHGAYGASEPEIQVVEDYLRSLFPDQRADDMVTPAPEDATGIYIDVHSYGKLVMWPWGSTADAAPNSEQLQTLGRKLAYYNDYSPEQAIGLYPTDGTSDDHAYGELGVAAYCIELGTSFFQNCSTFESTIVPDNLPALLYAAKVVRTPFITPSGPNALSVEVVEGTAVAAGTPVTVQALVNDDVFKKANGRGENEPVQAIAAAEYYVDTPPWLGGIAVAMDAADGSFNDLQEYVTAMLDTAGLAPGRHMVFVRGRDAAGDWGAFSAAFLNISE